MTTKLSFSHVRNKMTMQQSISHFSSQMFKGRHFKILRMFFGHDKHSSAEDEQYKNIINCFLQ